MNILIGVREKLIVVRARLGSGAPVLRRHPLGPVAEFPFREAEEVHAEACGHEQLAASVDTARRRLLCYLNNHNSLATPWGRPSHLGMALFQQPLNFAD